MQLQSIAAVRSTTGFVRLSTTAEIAVENEERDDDQNEPDDFHAS
jgi:hypothetical protein